MGAHTRSGSEPQSSALDHAGLEILDGDECRQLLANAAVRAVPENAHPRALELATTIIPSAEHGGWAEIIPLLD